MKFDLNLMSAYPKFWDKRIGGGLLHTFLSADMIKMNYDFWKSQFAIDPSMTIRQNDGTALFKNTMREIDGASVLDMRAPLGDSVARDVKGIAYNTGSIPDFIAKSYHETALERENKQKQFESYFGDDATILLEYARNIQAMIDDADQTMNYMGAQLLSTGKIDYQVGDGIKDFLYDANVPAENITGVDEIWSTASTKILSQMVAIEESYYNTWGVRPNMKWQITNNMFINVFMNNDQVRQWVIYTNKVNNVDLPTDLQPTVDMALAAIAKFPGLSPIEVVKTQVKNGATLTNPWDDNVAVFRPAGYAGLVRHAEITDQQLYSKYGANNIDRTFAKVGFGGLYTLMNTTLNNGNLKEWHTDLMVAAMPTLNEFLYHVIVKTNETN